MNLNPTAAAPAVDIFLCPACRAVLQVPQSMRGVSGPCPSCAAHIRSPYGMPEVPAPPPMNAPAARDGNAPTASPYPGYPAASPPEPTPPIFRSPWESAGMAAHVAAEPRRERTRVHLAVPLDRSQSHPEFTPKRRIEKIVDREPPDPEKLRRGRRARRRHERDEALENRIRRASTSKWFGPVRTTLCVAAVMIMIGFYAFTAGFFDSNPQPPVNGRPRELTPTISQDALNQPAIYAGPKPGEMIDSMLHNSLKREDERVNYEPLLSPYVQDAPPRGRN